MTKYSKEFKREAVKLSKEIGVRKAAEQLNIPFHTLKDWRDHWRNLFPNVERTPEEAEELIRQLERKAVEDAKTIEILKEALSFFVQSRKK